MGLLDGWRFCPRCAGDLAPTARNAVCTRCGAEFWANGVPGAQALVERDGHLLLGRRRDDPGAGLWDLPGGFVEEEEHPEDALRREVLEETGLEIEPGDFLGVWLESYWNRTVVCLTWLARSAGGTERPGDDLVELAWFAPSALPGRDELAFPTYVDILARWRERRGRA
jgi:ADP-ribose pyrophosphatase YjhB (NUDIX family)